jgi:hypothetical protein
MEAFSEIQFKRKIKRKIKVRQLSVLLLWYICSIIFVTGEVCACACSMTKSVGLKKLNIAEVISIPSTRSG